MSEAKKHYSPAARSTTRRRNSAARGASYQIYARTLRKPRHADKPQSDPPVRVMFLGLRTPFGAQGGIESHVKDLVVQFCQRHGHEVALSVIERAPYVAQDRAIPDGVGAVKLIPIWAPRSAHFEAIIHTFLGVLYAAVHRPDVLHIHGIGPAIATPFAKILGLKVVTTHHGEDYALEKWGAFARSILKLGERFAAHFSDHRIVIAPMLASILHQRYRRAYDYIPNGVHQLTPSPRVRELAELKLSPGKYIVHVGRIVPEKRQLDLIEAFGRIEDPACKLLLIGGGDHKADYVEQVSQMAARDPRILLMGVRDRQTICNLLSQAAGFVLPSAHEGLPISLLEAASLDLPVLISDIANHRALDLSQDCYFPLGDKQALAEGMRLMLAASQPNLHRVDRSAWLAKFSIVEIARRTLQAYRGLAPVRSNRFSVVRIIENRLRA